MSRKTDFEKLEEELKEYTKTHTLFTSEMVRDHLLNTEIKFKKDMSSKKIGKYLSKRYAQTRKYNKTYYYIKEVSKC